MIGYRQAGVQLYDFFVAFYMPQQVKRQLKVPQIFIKIRSPSSKIYASNRLFFNDRQKAFYLFGKLAVKIRLELFLFIGGPVKNTIIAFLGAEGRMDV